MTDSSQNDAKTDIARLSPDKLVRRFRHSGIVACLLLALGLHVVVLGGTSVNYIHGLVDPAWKTQHDAEVEKARKAKAAANAPTTKPATTQPAGKTTDGKAKPDTKTKPATAPNGRRLPAELTTMPKPGEIPNAPGGGIGIDDMDTNK